MINSKNNTYPIPTYLIVIFGIALIVIAGILVSYFLHFVINKNFVIDQKNILNPQEIWAWFGDYVGGFSSSILAFLALIALLISIYHQINQFEKSIAELKYQNKLLENQIQEARSIKASEDEIKKIDATNDFLLEVIIALQELLAIKRNFYKKLETNPAQRALSFGPILTGSQVSNFKISKLAFLEKQEKLVRDSSGDIIHLSKILNDYNTILVMLKTRSDLYVDVIQKPLKENEKTLEVPIDNLQADQALHELLTYAGVDRGIKLIDLTEKLINFINRILKHLSKIILELPDIAEPLIAPNVLAEYNTIIRYKLKHSQRVVCAYDVPIDQCAFKSIKEKYVHKSNLK